MIRVPLPTLTLDDQTGQAQARVAAVKGTGGAGPLTHGTISVHTSIRKRVPLFTLTGTWDELASAVRHLAEAIEAERAAGNDVASARRYWPGRDY